MSDEKKKSILGKFLKLTSLVVVAIEDDSSENTTIHKLILGEPVSCTGSNVTDSGAPLTINNVKEVYVAGEDFDTFMEDVEEDGDVLRYKGKLKLDVSKPKGKVGRDGKAIITKPAKAWLVSVAFNKRGGSLIANNRSLLSDAVAAIFGKVAEDGKFTAPSAITTAASAGEGKPLQPVDTSKTGVPAGAGAGKP